MSAPGDGNNWLGEARRLREAEQTRRYMRRRLRLELCRTLAASLAAWALVIIAVFCGLAYLKG